MLFLNDLRLAVFFKMISDWPCFLIAEFISAPTDLSPCSVFSQSDHSDVDHILSLLFHHLSSSSHLPHYHWPHPLTISPLTSVTAAHRFPLPPLPLVTLSLLPPFLSPPLNSLTILALFSCENDVGTTKDMLTLTNTRPLPPSSSPLSLPLPTSPLSLPLPTSPLSLQ